MIAVIFEVWPQDGHRGDYFDLAADLRPHLEEIDGFISVERFESLTEKGKILSLSFWRDEEAIAQWRNLEQHRAAQVKGRSGVFANYRLRERAARLRHGEESRRAARFAREAWIDASPCADSSYCHPGRAQRAPGPIGTRIIADGTHRSRLCAASRLGRDDMREGVASQ